MSGIYKTADQLIGRTPLLELTHIEEEEELEARIVVKLEYFNPAGSVKDRIAKAMIDDAEAKSFRKRYRTPLCRDSSLTQPTLRYTGLPRDPRSGTILTETSISSWQVSVPEEPSPA